MSQIIVTCKIYYMQTVFQYYYIFIILAIKYIAQLNLKYSTKVNLGYRIDCCILYTQATGVSQNSLLICIYM